MNIAAEKIMNKYLLCSLFFIMCLFVSCTKSSSNVIMNNTAPGKIFTQVTLFGGPGNWGGGICSWGFIMIRQDTSITYHSVTIPTNVNINNTPVLVNILFHDTVQISSCWHEIVVDSIKF